MPRENAADKSKRYLCEGRVVLVHVSEGSVRAHVRGDGHVWNASFDGAAWFCDCPARSDQCSHLRAVRLVTAVGMER
jgi:uncharacterized Zn finger protein